MCAWKNLSGSPAFSEARLEDRSQEAAVANSQIAAAAAELESAHAALRLAEIALENAHVRAPFDGVVVRRLAEVGEYVTTGEAMIRLLDDQNLEIEAKIPTNRIAGLRPQARMRAEIAPGQDIFARVRAVIPDEDPRTRTRVVRFAIEPQSHTRGAVSNQSRDRAHSGGGPHGRNQRS